MANNHPGGYERRRGFVLVDTQEEAEHRQPEQVVAFPGPAVEGCFIQCGRRKFQVSGVGIRLAVAAIVREKRVHEGALL